MKKLLLLLLNSSLILANDLFVFDYAGKLEFSEVVSNKLNVVSVDVGKTYTLANNLSATTGTNSFATFVTPHRIAISQKESSSTFFNQDDIQYTNAFKLPEVLRVHTSQFNFSFSGETYCVSECTNQNVIATSMANVVFGKSKLFVKSGDKYTHVYVIEGNVRVIDNRSKKKKDLKENDYLVVTPQAALSPREAVTSLNSSAFSMKEVEDDEKNIHKQQTEELQGKLSNTLFVNYQSNIFGIKLK